MLEVVFRKDIHYPINPSVISLEVYYSWNIRPAFSFSLFSGWQSLFDDVSARPSFRHLFHVQAERDDAPVGQTNLSRGFHERITAFFPTQTYVARSTS